MRMMPHPRIETRLWRSVRSGWRQPLNYAAYLAWVLRAAREIGPAWVYASDAYGAPAGWLLGTLPGVRVLYHEHDTPTGAGGGFGRMARAARRRLARRAELCVLPNAERAARFGKEFGVAHKTVCVWNCPLREETEGKQGGSNRAGLKVMYGGSVVPARLPLTVIDAVAMAGAQVTLEIYGYETAGFPGYTAQLVARARELGIEERVRLHGALARAELLAACRGGDAGLALLPCRSADPNEEHMTGASNKPLDYMACGVPPLVTERADWRALLVERGFARSCDPGAAESIAGELRHWCEHPVERRAMGAAGQAQIRAEWNYETQFAPVQARLEDG
jgi:glycosyltransferase involved in cell wall biosynthesis